MKKFLIICLSILLIIPFSLIFPQASNNENANLAIVFTHDLHSHLDPFYYNGERVGGFSKIASVINNTKSKHDTLVLDGGDFSMGTLYQSIFQTEASEYIMLGELGYDAITFGNHEFDYGFDALSSMLSTAKSKSTSLPPVLSSNIDKIASGLSDKDLSDLNIQNYTIVNKGGLEIAIFGLLGRDAIDVTTDSRIVFKDFIQGAKDTISEIKTLHSPDLIVCLSHSGTGEDVNDEDILLAKEVPEIDVIISGHTHSTLNKPITVNNTIIASCGEYGMNVGEMILNVQNENVSLISYNLIKIDDSISVDEDIEKKISEFRGWTDKYLEQFGYTSADQVISSSSFDFLEQSLMYEKLCEQPLGNLISDSYIQAIKRAEGSNYINVDVSVAPLGVIRGSIDKGDITVSQVYEISSLGIGPDGVSGYPLCSVYLYGRELWDLAEVDASVSDIMPYAQLYFSGLGYSANKSRMFLNRVYDCWLIDSDGMRIEIEDDKLYRIVSGMSSAMMLGTVKEKSFGLLKLTPKDSDGKEIIDFEKHIAIDKNGSEVKEWKALADYLASFEPNTNGTPAIPEKYKSTEGRKTICEDFRLSIIFVNWNMITWIVLAVIILLIAIIVLIVYLITRKIKKKQRAKLNLSAEENENENEIE
jgi:2',3'-cyclic-nucleotide 2'-phosphodiesterase (5'-nucleotidase family)